MFKKLASLFYSFSAFFVVFIPSVASALVIDDVPAPTAITIAGVVNNLFTFIIWPIVALVVIVMFILAGFKFLTAQGDGSKINEARQAVIWGIVGVAVIVLSFSIMLIIRLTLGVGVQT